MSRNKSANGERIPNSDKLSQFKPGRRQGQLPARSLQSRISPAMKLRLRVVVIDLARTCLRSQALRKPSDLTGRPDAAALRARNPGI